MEHSAVTEGRRSTFIAYLFHDSPKKAGRAKKHENLCYLSLR